MSQQRVHSTVTLFSGIDGDIQVVNGQSSVLIDAQGASRGTDGVVRHNHGTVRLTYAAISELRDFLDHLDEPADPRQPSLPAIWSPATFIQPVRAPAHSLRRKVLA
jgi:hypothetical protein